MKSNIIIKITIATNICCSLVIVIYITTGIKYKINLNNIPIVVYYRQQITRKRMSQRKTKTTKSPKDPFLNPNHVKTTLEEVYNCERHKQKVDLKARINRALIDAKPGEYAPLTTQVDSLKSKSMSPSALKDLIHDIASTKRELTRENGKKEERNQGRIADLEARLNKLNDQKNAESALSTQIREAQKCVDAKLREDNKIARDKYAELCKAHKESENRKEKMETDGINALLQMTTDTIKESIKFIKIHTLYTLVIEDVLEEFTRRFNEHVDEVDTILRSFPLGRFLLSFSRREPLAETEYLKTYIDDIVALRDCSINTNYKERLREVFVNFMLTAVDCMLVLCNNTTTRLTFGDMIAYFSTVYFHQFGRDQSFTDLMNQYNTKLSEVVHKKKGGEEEAPAEENPESPQAEQPVV